MLMPPDLMIPAVATVVIVVIVAGTLYSLIKMYMKGGGARPTPADLKEIRDGLARMEQAIDAIAIEVERLSEGQRFTTRLLAEEGREAAQIPSAIRES
jgi:hypothetical protein